MQGKPVAEQEISRQLLNEVVAYAESGQCRRKLLLNYFGEEYDQENCGCCDNCLHPKPVFDGRKDMQLVIDLITSLPEHFKVEHLACILAGKENALIKSYRHDELEFFGKGSAHDERYWITVIHQGVVHHLLEKEIDTYGLISVTGAGLEFLVNPWKLELVQDGVFSDDGTDDFDDDETLAAANAVRGGGGCDENLLKMLKDLRKDVARRLHLQPWIIFGDPALQDMAILYPITLDELKNCQGVGEGKARKFGGEFVKMIAQYVEENDITRPDDFVVKSAPNKSANKIFIIQSIDRRMDLEDIASAKGMDIEELVSEIEGIVSTGTKLNLDYYIEENYDEEDVEEIYEYFSTEAESDSVEDAIAALGGDFEELEIRLIRVKFLCDIAS
jgi:ATP-dependent DNA helicase RecQ